MRLSSLVPSISAENVAHLEASGIRTDSELLFTPLFEVYRKLPPRSLSLQDLARLCTTVTELCAVEPVLATDVLGLVEDSMVEDVELSVGDEEVDRVLRGLGGERVIEISGDREVGKSILALNVALNFLVSHSNESVAWIDTSGDFSPGIAYEILSSHQCENPDAVLDRLQVSLVFDIDALHAVLDEISEGLVGAQPRIIIIDTITLLLGPLLTGVTSHGHALTTDLMRRLREMAYTTHCTVLVVNNATLKEPYDPSKRGVLDRKPALGPTFTFMSDTTLWLSRKISREGEDQIEETVLQVLKSRNKASGGSTSFCISEGRFHHLVRSDSARATE